MKPKILQQPPSHKGKVVIAQNLIRERVMLDKDGNEINPRTKEIIRKADEQ